jgi:hypothetical protein
VTVPEGNASKRVEVTVVDDDGESATDVITLTSSISSDLNYVERPTTRTAECTYFEYGGKAIDQPIRCWNKKTGELVYDRDPNEGPEDFVGPHSHPDWDVDWYRVARPDDDTIRPGAAEAKDVPGPSNPTQEENTARANTSAPRNETLVNTVNSADINPGYESYVKNGKSVSNDLTGDDTVDLQDWQERYGDPTAKSIEADSEKIQTLHSDSVRETSGDNSDGTADNGGLGDTVRDAFEDLTSSVSSVVSGGADDNSNREPNDSEDDGGIEPAVSNTVDSITEAFRDLGGGDEDTGEESSSSSSSEDDTGDTGSSSNDSCTSTTLGFEICF